MYERLGRKRTAQRECRAARTNGLNHLIVSIRRDHNCGVCMILRGRPHHRRSTNINVFNHISCRLPRGNRLLERVQVYHNEFKRRVPELFELLTVIGQTKVGEEARVHRRVQRLYSPVERLSETGHLGHVCDRDPRTPNGLSGGSR